MMNPTPLFHGPAAIKFAWTTSAAALTQIGPEIGGAIGEIVKFSGIGGVAVFALWILTRAYRERDSVQHETIAELREENERLRARLKEKEL